jgi:hypothetical protein
MSTISALHLIDGDGLVQRHGPTVVVLGDAEDTGHLHELVLRDCRELSGPELLRRLVQRVLGDTGTDSIRLGVVTTDGRRPLAFLHGDVELRTTDEIVSGAGFVTGVEVALDTASSLTVAPAGNTAGTDDRTDLIAGVVAASGFRLELAPCDDLEPETTEIRRLDRPDDPPGPVEAPSGSDEVELIDLVAAPEIRPLPIDGAGSESVADDGPRDAVVPEPPDAVLIDGVRCARDHHNDPRAVYCAHCGLKLGAHRTLRPVAGPRPQLGVLVLDDGTTIPVDHDLVLGREPDEHELVARGSARAAAVHDPSQTVSRTHAHVALEDWDVHLADLGSANGTFVRLASEDRWFELAGRDRIHITSGTTIRLGDRELVFHSHDLAHARDLGEEQAS